MIIHLGAQAGQFAIAAAVALHAVIRSAVHAWDSVRTHRLMSRRPEPPARKENAQ